MIICQHFHIIYTYNTHTTYYETKNITQTVATLLLLQALTFTSFSNSLRASVCYRYVTLIAPFSLPVLLVLTLAMAALSVANTGSVFAVGVVTAVVDSVAWHLAAGIFALLSVPVSLFRVVSLAAIVVAAVVATASTASCVVAPLLLLRCMLLLLGFTAAAALNMLGMCMLAAAAAAATDAK